ncbi:MAG: hypothetical protein QOH57_1207 [Mycobacterium sp.]|jgi:hypothetical protein|nr:hypothetical protein [Mycobacterium sp.]
MRLAALLGVLAVAVLIVRSRRRDEVWHVAADEPPEGP